MIKISKRSGNSKNENENVLKLENLPERVKPPPRNPKENAKNTSTGKKNKNLSLIRRGADTFFPSSSSYKFNSNTLPTISYY